MPSQHGASTWLKNETKRVARRSAEIVKGSWSSDMGTSTPPLADNSPIKRDRMVPEELENGTTMTKISEKGEKKLLFKLDGDEGKIFYTSSREGLKVVPIECIKELRTGPQTTYYRQQFKQPESLEALWLTIVYIVEGNYKTLHIIAPDTHMFQAWSDAINKLITIRQGLMSGLGNVEMRQNIWERQYWKGADEEGDQVLDFDDVERLCKRLNANVKPDELTKMFKDADTQNRGHLDYPQFQQFVRVLKRRPEVERMYATICLASGGQFTLAAFTKFLKESQKCHLSDSEIKSLFERHASSTPVATAPPTDPQALPSQPVLSLDAFSSFLMSPDNVAFVEQDKPVWQDMTAPISDYYISSSHNTYLVGHQLVGVSTIEGYIRALLHSCRSVELDIYDGDKEPMIYHGKTLTSKVSLRDICIALSKYAFQASPYPVLISAEVHCCVEQQEKIVSIMNEVFGDSLIQAPVEGRPKIEQLPSPESLKNKFLLKAKNLFVVEQLAAVKTKVVEPKAAVEADTPSDTSSDSDDGSSKLKEGLNSIKSKFRMLRTKESPAEQPHKVKMSLNLVALLVYTIGVKCQGLTPEIDYAPEHIFSLSENAANRLVKGSMSDLVRHTHTHLVRVYPKGTRVSSTNYEPHKYWASGCQVVAINWQTFDLGYMINQAMFQRNGRAGYVLKPEALRHPEKAELLSKRTQHFFDITIISAQQLPRLRDAQGREIIHKSIVDPFVQVSLHIPDWTHSPFLPDSHANSVKYSPSTNGSATSVSSARTVTVRTKVVKDNGFNPVWEEELCIPFDCLGDMKDLIFVEIQVRQEGKEDDDDEPIGVYCIPLGCLQQGFRHIPLHDAQLSQHLFSTLFVNVNIRDID
ncbi:1-phosphatidylinositol-4,5-bisphosphate phosphodiesterase 1 [Crepidotus variabilis]|uniref:Phosphoinositide phospholipase C n=1 Tax=Crepidotus variabilis TaxID=179855 RepID=A0A9P6JST5_9AGAR|nr:1-phosphatidylinositol-4,5-bisphosphate phosphodiesterase 1 [Crepidotus variabilis]